MSYLTGGNLKDMRTGGGLTVGQMISAATKELKDCINAEIDAFYSSYRPTMYVRTKAFKDVFKNAVAKGIEYIPSEGVVRFTLDYNLDKAAHKSWDGGKSDVVKLLNYGYKTSGKPNKLPYARNPFNFIEKGVNKFNATNKYGAYANPAPLCSARKMYRV